MKEIEMKIEDEREQGAFAMSLVSSPAMEAENFVALSEHKIELTTASEERRIVVGFALIPEKRIVRKMDKVNNGEPFNIWFSKETVAKTAELYMKKLNLNNVTTQHEKPTTNVSMVESWVVEDPKNDKSNIFGLKPKGGEWAVMMKIDNDEEWAKYKDGEYDGLSLEGLYDGFEQLMKSEEEEILDALKNLLNV